MEVLQVQWKAQLCQGLAEEGEGEASMGTCKQNTCHKRLFHPSPEGSVFMGQRKVQFPPHSALVLSQLQAAGASDTHFQGAGAIYTRVYLS